MSLHKKLQIPLDAAQSGVWVCFSRKHNLLAKFSFAETEKEAIALFMDGATAPWDYFQREHGWECNQITIQIPTK